MKRLEQQLTALKKPSMDSPLHRAQLRRVLLNSSRTRFGSFTSLTMSFYKLLPASLALVLVFGLAFTFRSGQTPDYVRYVAPTASAQELVTQVLENVKNLSTEDLAAIQENGSLPSDEMLQILADAVTAPDLNYMEYKTITCAEAAQGIASGMPSVSTMHFTFPQSDATTSDVAEIILGDEEGCTSAYEIQARPDARFPNGFSEVHSFEGDYVEAPLTYLEYTKSNGDHVYLGLSEDLSPVYAGNISDGVFAPGFDFTGASWMNVSDDGEEGFILQTNGATTVNAGMAGELTVTNGGDSKADVYFSETNHSESSEETPQELTVDENGCTSWQSDDGLMGGGGC